MAEIGIGDLSTVILDDTAPTDSDDVGVMTRCRVRIRETPRRPEAAEFRVWEAVDGRLFVYRHNTLQFLTTQLQALIREQCGEV